MKKRRWLIICVILIILLIFIYFIIPKKDNSYITIKLNGSVLNTIELGKTYKEAGFSATDSKDGDITDKVKITSNINYEKEGSYIINYDVSNNGVSSNAKRFVKIVKPENINYKDEYDEIDNSSNSWWPGTTKNHSRPTDGANSKIDISKYNAYNIGTDNKTIYLTFDEGSLETYVKEIMDVLNDNDVKGTFFLCRGFIVKNPELIKQLVKNGHSIGNHTANHLNMPSLATRENFEKYKREIKSVEDSFYKITGTQMDKIYREPRGEYSLRSLSIVKDMGYKTFFWSASYMDFNGELSKEKALNLMLSKYHNGAIYLIHPNNKGNYLALDDFIKEMKKKGYKFDLVKNIK
jgi:delta-lactam-biosynthetic de-N-acetylase